MNLLSITTARNLRGALLAISIASLIMVFQPFSLWLFAAGCVLTFISALAFNLMPFLRAGGTWKDLRKAALIIVIAFAVIFALAIIATYGYVLYLQTK